MGEARRTCQSADNSSKGLLTCVQACEKCFAQIEARLKHGNLSSASQSDAYQSEIHLWQELKSSKCTSNPCTLQYLIGFYTRLQQCLLLHSSGNKKIDPYMVASLDGCQRKHAPLLYNVHIRLGDLQRYANQNALAKAHYLRARNLNPHRGQSYNQLALLCASDSLKSIYYYVRAYLANEDAFEISRNNIKYCVTKSNHSLVRMLFSTPVLTEQAPRVDNWLFVIVIAMYAKCMDRVATILLHELRITLERSNSTKKLDEKLAFSALDVLLDYVIVQSQPQDLHKQTEQLQSVDLVQLEQSLKQVREALAHQTGVRCFDEQTDQEPALKHDYMLLGLKPLKNIHAKLIFSPEQQGDAFNLLILIKRLMRKLDSLGPIIAQQKIQINQQKKKKRNIALQSILSARNEG